MTDFKIGDYVHNKKTNVKGYIYDIDSMTDYFKLADEWGTMDNMKRKPSKDFKVKKRETKNITKNQKVMDAIKSVGREIGESNQNYSDITSFLFENLTESKKQPIPYTIENETKYNKMYNDVVNKLSKGGEITDDIKVKASKKVYVGKTFINMDSDVEYSITFNKKYKNPTNMLRVTATRNGESQEIFTSSGNIPFMIG